MNGVNPVISSLRWRVNDFKGSFSSTDGGCSKSCRLLSSLIGFLGRFFDDEKCCFHSCRVFRFQEVKLTVVSSSVIKFSSLIITVKTA